MDRRIVRGVLADTSEPLQQTAVPQESPATIVIFGASGDLTARKLIPALFSLCRSGGLSRDTLIVGAARQVMSDDGFREAMRSAVSRDSHLDGAEEAAWTQFARRLHYQPTEFDAPADFEALHQRILSLEGSAEPTTNRLYYLAVAPQYFLQIVRQLAEARMAYRRGKTPWARVVIEKPFGADLESARALNAGVMRYLREDQIFRIDHYLGKDTVQNLLAFRLGNGIFEPLFNRRYVDHIQVTAAESIGVGSGRGDYYDKAGAMRDVLQNHVLQLLALIAMEPPAVAGAKEIRDEKVKVLQCLRGAGDDISSWVVAGQYGHGTMGGHEIPAYREEERVPPDSCTDTYIAMRIAIDNWRWAGVPFLLRAGKRLAARTTSIIVVFRQPPTQFFSTVHCEGDLCELAPKSPNALVFQIQPDEGVTLRLSVKQPGMSMNLHDVDMRFSYDQAFMQSLPDAYERLLVDVLRGDQTLFTRSDEIERAWEFVDPILDHLRQHAHERLHSYAPGTWGPSEADRLLSGAESGWWNGGSFQK